MFYSLDGLAMKGSTVTTQLGSTDVDSAHAAIAVMVHLSGSRRGTSERLSGDSLRIGTGSDATIHFLADREPSVSSHHATLHRQDHSYELMVEVGEKVWVNGERAERVALASGDLLQIGETGPLLRFRLYRDAGHPYKSVRESISDCIDCARHGRGTLDQAAVLLTTMPKELVTQASPWFRRVVLVLLVFLTAGLAGLTWRSLQLEERLAGEGTRFAETSDRVAALEARIDAGTRIISDAAQSVVFLQGAVRFIDPDSQKPLRFLGLGPDGQPFRDPRGL